MKGYKGEKVLDSLINTKYEHWNCLDWAFFWIDEMYSSECSHANKDLVVSQITRILEGENVLVLVATWENGSKEYRFRLEEDHK